jgi:DNA-binding HxlR family transcriptional regulator
LLIQDLLRFNELRFSQGKIEFDTLTRTRLELLALKEALQRLRQKKTAVELKLTHVGEQ